MEIQNKYLYDYLYHNNKKFCILINSKLHIKKIPTHLTLSEIVYLNFVNLMLKAKIIQCLIILLISTIVTNMHFLEINLQMLTIFNPSLGRIQILTCSNTWEIGEFNFRKVSFHWSEKLMEHLIQLRYIFKTNIK